MTLSLVPSNPIVGVSGIGNIETTVSLDGGKPEVDTGRDFPSIGLITDLPRTSDVSACVDSGSVHVDVVCPLETLLLLPDPMEVMLRLWEVFTFRRKWGISYMTTALAAFVSELHHRMLLVDQLKVMIWNQHLDFEIGDPPVE